VVLRSFLPNSAMEPKKPAVIAHPINRHGHRQFPVAHHRGLGLSGDAGVTRRPIWVGGCACASHTEGRARLRYDRDDGRNGTATPRNVEHRDSTERARLEAGCEVTGENGPRTRATTTHPEGLGTSESMAFGLFRKDEHVSRAGERLVRRRSTEVDSFVLVGGRNGDFPGSAEKATAGGRA